ncbi:MAG: hypothetical protein EZS28_027886 [Streblomastix strix]|uniref:Uncharacterized protein n=1 Tax=Streblomastix strix TaxID=222440 RepID=A0A5J4V1K0_9EUKA|nr:MAG: hypothetical protein EZS28_027886 [Streblomastix strix]
MEPHQPHKKSKKEKLKEEDEYKENEIVQITFDAWHPVPEDANNLAGLFESLLDESPFHPYDLADLVIDEAKGGDGIGSVVCTDQTEDVIGVITCIGIQQNKDLGVLKEITAYLRKLINKNKNDNQGKINKSIHNSLLRALDDNSHSGLILFERMFNLPPELAPNLYNILLSEINKIYSGIEGQREKLTQIIILSRFAIDAPYDKDIDDDEDDDDEIDDEQQIQQKKQKQKEKGKQSQIEEEQDNNNEQFPMIKKKRSRKDNQKEDEGEDEEVNEDQISETSHGKKRSRLDEGSKEVMNEKQVKQTKTSKTHKKRKSTQNERYYLHPEDKLFLQHKQASFTFPIKSDSFQRAGEPIRKIGLLILMSVDQFRQSVNEMESFINEGEEGEQKIRSQGKEQDEDIDDENQEQIKEKKIHKKQMRK